MPLYSSKGLDNNNHETIRNTNNMQKFPYQFQEITRLNPSLPSIFHHNSKNKASKRDSAPLLPNRQELASKERHQERDSEFPK
jgi:hypothetical protein